MVLSQLSLDTSTDILRESICMHFNVHSRIELAKYNLPIKSSCAPARDSTCMCIRNNDVYQPRQREEEGGLKKAGEEE